VSLRVSTGLDDSTGDQSRPASAALYTVLKYRIPVRMGGLILISAPHTSRQSDTA